MSFKLYFEEYIAGLAGVEIDFSGLFYAGEEIGDRSEAKHARMLPLAAGVALVSPELVRGDVATLCVVTHAARVDDESSPAGLAPHQLAGWRSTLSVGAESHPFIRLPTGRKASDDSPLDATNVVLVSRGLVFSLVNFFKQ